MTEQPEVIVRVAGRVGRLTLNRPQALNALTLAMCREMTQALLAWRDDPAIELVLIDHAGERGFCAGGDIRNLARGDAGDGSPPGVFFHTEYRLDHLLFTYAKPVVALIDGVVMGGGVGIAMPARYRVATERTSFAMPETGVGLFPDVGGSWLLPRLPGRAGFWLGLTGARLGPADCVALGLASHYVELARLDALKAAIIAGPGRIGAILSEFACDPGSPPLAGRRADIDRLFAGDSVTVILEALDADGSDWAAEQATRIRVCSPLMTKVALRELTKGLGLASFAEAMALEYRIAVRAVPGHDFSEGVRALILDRDNAPRWSPASLDEVTESMVDAFFAPLPDGEEWTPLTGKGDTP